MRVLLDTNCLVALALPSHEYHAATHAEFHRRRGAGHEFIVAAHAITEAYSVLTRLPAPHRLAPADARDVLERTWRTSDTVALTAAELWRVVRTCADSGTTGGRIHDTVIAQCARKGKAAEVLTWNVRHFDDAPGVRAVRPNAD